jgi:chromosome segregation ATPase
MPDITAPKRMAPIINADGTPTQIFVNWAEEVSRDTNAGSVPDQFGEITSVFALMFKADFDVQKINQELAGIQELIDEAQANITTLQGNVSVINGQINTITADISTIDAQISTITNDITSIQSSVATNLASIAALNTGVATNLSSINTLITDVSSNAASISENAASISSAEIDTYNIIYNKVII